MVSRSAYLLERSDKGSTNIVRSRQRSFSIFLPLAQKRMHARTQLRRTQARDVYVGRYVSSLLGRAAGR